jgi:Lyase
MADTDYRVERDSMGETRVPAGALWGAQTQRAIQNFPISGLAMPRGFIRALGLVKWAGAGANLELGDLDRVRAFAIQRAALEVAEGRHDAHFPVDVFQTGSGTSSNMNANEVIARLATGYAGGPTMPVHANDHVNRGQSSNDVIPTVIHRRRRDREDGPHAPDGRHAGDARAGDGRMAYSARRRSDAAAELPATAPRTGPGRDGGGHGHQRQSAVRA